MEGVKKAMRPPKFHQFPCAKNVSFQLQSYVPPKFISLESLAARTCRPVALVLRWKNSGIHRPIRSWAGLPGRVWMMLSQKN